MADWEEIKRLAADFQRVQLSSTSQRLSERNCIEVVQKLIELKLIDILYTTDGKEYLTPNELTKEIREELVVRGGRINLVELQQSLNVDLTHVESKVAELTKNDRSLTLILGQLIDRNYVDRLSEEINDKLQRQGLVTTAELAKAYDLPGDFINQTIHSRLGRVIKAQADNLDRNVFYTDAFVSQHQSKITGAFSAVTKPTSVSSIIGQFNLHERLCISILDELIGSGRLPGSLLGGRHEKATYVPDVYTKSQNDWVDSFFKQNGYLEYDALTRLGIQDAKNFVKKRFKNESLEFLESCCLGKVIRERVESEMEEILSVGGWIDIMPFLPSICSSNDAQNLLHQIITKEKSSSATIIFCDSIVTNEELVKKCLERFDDIVKVRAEKAVRENPSLLLTSTESGKKLGSKMDSGVYQKEEKKDQRKKKAGGGGKGGGSGGGVQGREIKTKAVKKKTGSVHNRGQDDDVSDDDEVSTKSTKSSGETEFMTIAEICEELKKETTLLKDASEEFIQEIAEKLYRSLTQQYTKEMKNVFLQTMQNTTSASKRKTHVELAEKVVGLWTNGKLFEKGIALFNDDVQQTLQRHLLQSLCTDIANMIFKTYANDNMITIDDKEVTPEVRVKILSMLTDEKTKQILSRIHASLNSKTVDDFFTHMETICESSHMDIPLKKPDKKKERQLIFNHKHSLSEQLRGEVDAAMALHLTVTLLVQVHTQCMVYAPGKCVPQIIAFLKERLTSEQYQVIVKCQELVMKRLRSSSSSAASSLPPSPTDDAGNIEKDDDISIQLNELLPKVKEIALHAKHSSTAAAASPDDNSHET